jgi:hypothetical protein
MKHISFKIFADRLTTQRGSSLVMVLGFSAVLLAVSLSAIQWMASAQSLAAKQSARDPVELFLRSIRNRVSNNETWHTISSHSSNSSISCANSETCCTSGGGSGGGSGSSGPGSGGSGSGSSGSGAAGSGSRLTDVQFGVTDQAGTIIYDARAVASTGFDITGNTCSTFSAISGEGNDACPYRADIKVSNMSDGSGACIEKLQFSVEFKYNPRNQVKGGLNISDTPGAARRYTFTRDLNGESLEAFCKSVSGTFDAAKSNCQLGIVGGLCAPPTFLRGFNPDGSVLCTAVDGGIAPVTNCLAGLAAGGLTLLPNQPGTTNCIPFPKPPLPGPPPTCDSGFHIQQSSSGTQYCYSNVRGPCTPAIPGGYLLWDASNPSAGTCAGSACNSVYTCFDPNYVPPTPTPTPTPRPTPMPPATMVFAAGVECQNLYGSARWCIPSQESADFICKLRGYTSATTWASVILSLGSNNACMPLNGSWWCPNGAPYCKGSGRCGTMPSVTCTK